MANDYRTSTKKPRSVAEYTRMRGVTDFTNAAQFNVYETGYSFLVIISKPIYLTTLAGDGTNDVAKLLNTFCHILENEFRGLDGIDDITADNITFTDGISEMNSIGKVTQQSATEISMTFTEKTGGVITKFVDYYLRGIKDPRTQAKTYHGLIKDGKLAAGFENEVFNLMYIVTDSTMLSLEKAYLLADAWPTKAPTSIYNTTKGDIDKKEIELSWQCFLIDGEEVNKRALQLLTYISEPGAVKNVASANESSKAAVQVAGGITEYAKEQVTLDSSEYLYDAVGPSNNDSTNKLESFSSWYKNKA